jgi:transcriptional regulator with XRE-family HTH domain
VGCAIATFGSRLQALRNKIGLTQEEFAKKFQISKSAVGMYERDEREPSFELVKRFADFFGVTTDYLLGRTDDPNGRSIPEAGERITREERKLLDTVRKLPPDKREQVSQFADFLKSQEGKDGRQHHEESATVEPDDIEADITEIAAHMESEYGIDDPGFVEHVHNVIRRTLRKYDEMSAEVNRDKRDE